MSRSRLEAFSDGVMAVAITLLALDLAVDGPGHGPLVDQLTHRWPVFVAYIISFFTIGIIWVNHHALVQDLAVVNRALLFLNLALLLFVVAIPFGTSLMAEYLTEDVPDARLATAIYALIFEGMAVSFSAIFAWSLGVGRRHHPFPEDARRSAWLRFGIGSLIYVAAILLAFIEPLASVAIIGLVAVYYIFDRGQAGAA